MDIIPVSPLTAYHKCAHFENHALINSSRPRSLTFHPLKRSPFFGQTLLLSRPSSSSAFSVVPSPSFAPIASSFLSNILSRCGTPLGFLHLLRARLSACVSISTEWAHAYAPILNHFGPLPSRERERERERQERTIQKG